MTAVSFVTWGAKIIVDEQWLRASPLHSFHVESERENSPGQSNVTFSEQHTRDDVSA